MAFLWSLVVTKIVELWNWELQDIKRRCLDVLKSRRTLEPPVYPFLPYRPLRPPQNKRMISDQQKTTSIHL
jgi:hypothetical protein